MLSVSLHRDLGAISPRERLDPATGFMSRSLHSSDHLIQQKRTETNVNGVHRQRAVGNRDVNLQVMGLMTVMPITFTVSMLNKEQRMVCFSSGVFFSPFFYLQLRRGFIPPNWSKTGIMSKPLLVSSAVWERKNYLPSSGFTPFHNKCLREKAWSTSQTSCLSPLTSKGVTRTALGQVSDSSTAMERQSQLFP